MNVLTVPGRPNAIEIIGMSDEDLDACLASMLEEIPLAGEVIWVGLERERRERLAIHTADRLRWLDVELGNWKPRLEAGLRDLS